MSRTALLALTVGLLLLLFVSGIVVGVAADRLWFRPSSPMPFIGFGMGGPSGPMAQRFVDTLDLSEAQEIAVRAAMVEAGQNMHELMQDSWPKREAIVHQARDKIRAVLTEAQKKRFEDMIEQRRRWHPGFGGPGGMPPPFMKGRKGRGPGFPPWGGRPGGPPAMPTPPFSPPSSAP